MAYLFENEWFFLMASEGLMWVFVCLFLICRYKLLLDRLSQLFLIWIIICDLFQALLVGFDYYFTGKVSFFQIVTILFFIYASTLGSSDFKRLDAYIKQKYHNNQRILTASIIKHRKKINTYRRYLFIAHSASFFLAHILWYITDSSLTGFPNYHVFIFNEWIQYPHQGYYSNSAINIISYMWKIFYSFDVIVFLIYTFWQVKRKQTRLK